MNNDSSFVGTRPWLPAGIGFIVAVGSAAFSLVAADYPAKVLSDSPVAYYRFGDAPKSTDFVNLGSAGSAANATNFNVRTVGGALAGSRDAAGYFNGSGGRAIIPFHPAVNPPATESFTIESWINTSVEVTDSPGPAPLMNRYSYSGVNRQGWVFFQRSPTTGWNFRTYKGEGSSTGINITGQSANPDAGKAGTWSHVAAVWDATTSTARLYVNGEKVAEGEGAYVANTNDHPESEAVRGAAGLSIGSYNNTEPGSNPFHGKVDEVALYAKALTDAQLLAHYQNGINPARAVAYEDLIKSHQPNVYLRFSGIASELDVAVNLGTAGAAGDGISTAGVIHPVAGAVVGETDGAYGFRPKAGGGGMTTIVPWTAALNPPAENSFSVESWFYVAQEVTDSPGPAPIMNRYSYSGVDRQGWVYFQRSPTTGWNFRMYKGTGSSTGVDITGQSTLPNAGTAGTWNHVVTVWDGPGSKATMYVNGEQVAEGTGTYVANTDDHDPAVAVRGPAGFGIGSYNNSGPGENQYNGRVDEVAFYDYMLTPEQITAHYKNAMDPKRTLPYEAVVLADKPVEFLRFDETAFNPAANSASSGIAADGARAYGSNAVAGPGLAGFESGNQAVQLDGVNTFVSLGNPVGPVLDKQVTVEAWIKPDATQAAVANVVARVPSLSDEDDIALVLTEGGNYNFGTSEAGVRRGASAAIPPTDLGGANWVFLAGTYDGSKWNLYRNGVLVNSAADAAGLPVSAASDWAIGASGDGIGDVFAGGIDEVAIYNKALSEAQIKAHYDAATAAAPVETKITASRVAGKVTITWSGGTLQSSAVVNGPYTDVAGATSPLNPSGTDAARFYRVKR